MSAPPKRILLVFRWYLESLHSGVLSYCVERGWEAKVLEENSVGAFAPESFDGILSGLADDRALKAHLSGVPASGSADAEDTVLRFVASAGVPVVELSPSYPENKHWGRCPSDGVAAGRMAAEYLRRRPVASFVFAANAPGGAHTLRRDAFLSALAGEARPVVEFYTGGDDVAAIGRLASFLKNRPGPVAVFGSVDATARLALSAALEAGMKVPGDAYILGFGNRDLVSRLAPVPLSSIAIDYPAWGYAAAGLLDAMMSGAAAPGTVRPFAPGELVERASTGGESGGDPLCARALKLMREHVSDPLDVAGMAMRLGVSKATLDRAFSSAYGEGVARRYLELRMEVAKGLLASGEKVESVSASVGFASCRAFGEAFRKAAGCTPGEFAKRRADGPA